MKGYKSTVELADALGVTHQTILNWIMKKYITPALVDKHGRSMFSDEQYNGMVDNLPLPPVKERPAWLSQFNVEETFFEERKNHFANTTRIIVPSKNSAFNPDDPEETHKISHTVAVTNKLLLQGLTRKTNIHDITQLSEHTQEYFKFCELEGFVPSFRSLCNWYGYSLRYMDRFIKETDTPEAQVLEIIRDTIKTNYEQAALNNKVNSIFAMFLLKSQEGYVETQKQVIEHINPLGNPKSASEIADFIDADIIEVEE